MGWETTLAAAFERAAIKSERMGHDRTTLADMYRVAVWRNIKLKPADGIRRDKFRRNRDSRI